MIKSLKIPIKTKNRPDKTNKNKQTKRLKILRKTLAKLGLNQRFKISHLKTLYKIKINKQKLSNSLKMFKTQLIILRKSSLPKNLPNINKMNLNLT